ncbi:MAG: DMT family transporter, partial [Phycisphaerae bacterium]
LNRRPYVVGIVLLLAAAVLWSLNGALIKLIHEEGRGPHGVTIAFYRSLFAGLFLLPLARGRFHTLQKKSSDRKTQKTSPATPLSLFAIRHSLFSLRPAAISCVIFFTLMTVCFVLANIKTKAANAIILQYTSTFWVFGLSPWMLREKPRMGDIWILGLAMIGIVIIFVGNAATDLFGLVIALGAGLFFGLLTLMIRQMRDSDSAAVTVLNNLGSALLLLPAALLVGGLMVSTRAWILLIVMGVVQFGLPYYLYTLGLVRVPAYQAALLTLIEPVLVPVWTYLAVREKVPLMTVVGGGVILLALLLFLRAASIQRKAKR